MVAWTGVKEVKEEGLITIEQVDQDGQMRRGRPIVRGPNRRQGEQGGEAFRLMEREEAAWSSSKISPN